MKSYIRIGVDIAQNSFQVHALESEDGRAARRKLSRSGIVKFLAGVEPCLDGFPLMDSDNDRHGASMPLPAPSIPSS